MFWRETVTPADLKPFARNLLNERNGTFWQLDKDEQGKERLWWPSYDQDIMAVLTIIGLIEATADDDDQTFLESHLAFIEQLLKSLPMFQRLDFQDIVVTKGHKGITPYRHIINVIKTLNTYGATKEERILLRLEAIFHDLGKAISAGFEGNISELMEQFAHRKHSHPSHAEFSGLVIIELMQNKEIKNVFRDMGKRVGSDDLGGKLVKLIINHHIFEDLQGKIMLRKDKEENGGFDGRVKIDEDVKAELGRFTPDEWLLFMLTFRFSRADMGSTPDYRQYWPEKTWMMAQILRAFWSSLKGIDKNNNDTFTQIRLSVLRHQRLPKEFTSIS
jgi:hypothetical protein